MKTAIYITVAVLLLLISGAVVILYYTQDFSEKFNFVSSVSYKDIEIQTYTQPDYNYNGANVVKQPETKYLQSAKAPLGDLVLENKGYFTQIYVYPQIVGCINLRSGVDKNNLLLRNNMFRVTYNTDSGNNYETSTTVSVGKEKTIKLVGDYYSNNIPLWQFSLDNIKSVSLYKLTKKENNPLGEGYDYNYPNNYNYGTSCESVESTDSPIAVILIN